MILLTKKSDIELARLYVLRTALKLQMSGLKRTGRQASVLIKELLGIQKSASLKETMRTINDVIVTKEKEYGIT